MIHLLSLLTSALVVMAVPLIAETRRDSPNPNTMYIEDYNYGGTGCPAGSAAVTLTPDRQTFDIIFDEFIATTFGSPLERRKDCTVAFVVNAPVGVTFAITNFTTEGSVDLGPAVTAIQKNTYGFIGSPQRVSAQTLFTGPRNGDYLVSESLPTEVYSPCGGSVILKAAISLTVSNAQNPTGNGTIRESEYSGKSQVKMQYKTVPCTA